MLSVHSSVEMADALVRRGMSTHSREASLAPFTQTRRPGLHVPCELARMASYMNPNKRPISVTAIAWLFVAVGTVTFLYHSPGLLRPHWDDFAVELTELLALIAGLFMLRRHNWARWLALAWMAFHVALSAFPPFHGLVFHVLILGGIAYLLFRSDATEYFRGEAG